MLDDRAFALHQRLDIRHLDAARLRNRGSLPPHRAAAEFRIGEGAFVPRRIGAIGEHRIHDAERAMRPHRHAERRRHPDVPILRVGRRLNGGTDARLLPHLGEGGGIAQVMRWVLLDDQLDIDAVLIAGFGQQRLGLLDIALRRRQLGVIGMDRRDVMMLGRRAELAEGDLVRLDRIDRHAEGLAHPRIVERLVLENPCAPPSSRRW